MPKSKSVKKVFSGWFKKKTPAPTTGTGTVPTTGTTTNNTPPGNKTSTTQGTTTNTPPGTKTNTTQGTTTGPTTPAAALTEKEKSQLAKRKAGLVNKIVKKAGPMKAPAATPQESEAEMKKQKSIEHGKTFGGGAFDVVSDTVDSVSNGLDIDMKRSWSDFGQGGTKIELQSSGVPIAGAILSAVKLLASIGVSIKNTVELVRASRKEGATGSEIQEQIFNWLEVLVNSADTVSKIMGTFSSFANVIPVVGAIIGAVAAALGFAKDVKQVVKASSGLSKMKKQKEAAKEAIKKKQGSGGTEYIKERSGRYDPANVFGTGMHFDNKKFGTVTDTKTQKSRDKRLDELTREQKESKTADHAMRRHLEDYDVTKELTGANEKRLREGILNIVFDDALHFSTALAGLDPTGVGGTVGAAINAAVGLGGLVKSGISAGRQLGRNKGWKGFDLNKSTDNKLQRRHNLAVVTFERIQELDKFKLENMEAGTTPAEEVKEALAAYSTVSQRISAMGVGYGPLARADSSNEMVKIMRDGFYREKS